MKVYIVSFVLLLLHFEILAQKANKIQVVKDYLIAAFNKDYEKQKALMHPEIIDYHPTILLPPAKGKEELIKGWMGSMEPMDSVIYTRLGIGLMTLKEGDNEGEWVIETGLVTTKVKGRENWIKWEMVGFYQVEDGLITEVRNSGNTWDIYQQVGYTLKAPGQE